MVLLWYCYGTAMVLLWLYGTAMVLVNRKGVASIPATKIHWAIMSDERIQPLNVLGNDGIVTQNFVKKYEKVD